VEVVVSLTILTTVLIFLLLILLALQLQITHLNREVADIGSNLRKIASELDMEIDYEEVG
jgi:hypothetical protein